MQQLQDIDEVNMFKDDHTVIHFKKPQSKWNSLPKSVNQDLYGQSKQIDSFFFVYSIFLR
mgnify:CR=1 FL=1